MVLSDGESETSSTITDEGLEDELEDNTPAPPVNSDLQELIKQIENYPPTVPDAITMIYLKHAGIKEADPCLVRVLSVAAQRFISDIANDALQHCKTRTNNTQHSSAHASKDKKPNKDRKYALAVEDLTPALADHGITVRKPQYFV